MYNINTYYGKEVTSYYINEVRISVKEKLQSQYAGEYIIVPCFYFNIV